MVESRSGIVGSSFAGKITPGGSHTDLVVRRDTDSCSLLDGKGLTRCFKLEGQDGSVGAFNSQGFNGLGRICENLSKPAVTSHV